MIYCVAVKSVRQMKMKEVVKFPDLALQAIMKGLDAITKRTYFEALAQHSGDGAGGTLGSGMRSLR